MADPAALNSDRSETSPVSPGRKRVMGRVLVVIAAIGVVALVYWYIGYHTVGRFQQSTNNAFIKADAVTVSPKVAGYVQQVFVAENEAVHLGKPLLRVDAGTYVAQADQSQAQIAIARASADAIKSQIAEQDATIERAQGDVQTAQADVALTSAQVARYMPLVNAGVETREKLDQLKGQASQAAGRLTTARAAMLSAERRVATLRAQVRQAQAQGSAAEAQLRSANNDVGGAVIRASIDGRIGNLSVRTGQYVQAGTRLMSIVPVQRLYVEANFKETQLELMRVGQPVKVAADALPDLEIAGRVASISPGTGAQFSVLPPQNATGNFTKVVQRVPVRIEILPSNEARALLVAGMSVEVTVDTRSARDARAAIIRAQEKANAAVGR